MDFSYRHSVLHEQPGIVVSVRSSWRRAIARRLQRRMASYKERRLRTQPLQMACAGSVFRNPPDDFAARLIQEAGLKGNAQSVEREVSEQHANFIVNTGQATAEDVLTLMTTYSKHDQRAVMALIWCRKCWWWVSGNSEVIHWTNW